MSYPRPLVERLATHVAHNLAGARPGHCARVDNLGREDCELLAAKLEEAVDGLVVGVLDDEPGAPAPAMRPEQAIEIRNRKEQVLCLLVPSGTPAPTASSLHNAFAEIDMERALETIVDELVDGLGPELASAVRLALVRRRGFGSASAEQRASFVAAVAEDPTPVRAGAELWRLGLIPDSLGFELRLEDNRRCTGEISRPRVATTTVAQRLNACRVDVSLPAYSKLLDLLQSTSAPLATGVWQRELTSATDLVFSQWPLVPAEPSDLKAIVLKPFVNDKGMVDRASGLSGSEEERGLPRAKLGPKAKVTVSWEPEPGTPAAVSKWQIQLIPSREEYGDLSPAVDFPMTTVTKGRKRGALKLDLDVDAIETQIAQVSVVALDEHGVAIVDSTGEVIEGLSQEFILDGATVEEEDEKVRRSTVVSIPVARVNAAGATNAEAIQEDGGTWVVSGDDSYFSVTLTGGIEARINVPSVLVALERRILESSSPVSLRVDVDAGDVIDTSHCAVASTVESLSARWRELAAALGDAPTRGTVESADWRDETIRKRVRSYVAAWRRAITETDDPGELADLVAAGTVHLTIRRGGRERTAVVATSLHPVRLAWFLRYTDLLGDWERELIERGKDERQIDIDLLSRLAPLNTPPFVMGMDASVHLFVRNVGLSHGLYLPPDDLATSQASIDALRALGAPSADGDLPASRLTTAVRDYQRSHSYLRGLELTAVNPGDGAFLAQSIRDLWKPRDESEEDLLLKVHVEAYDDTARTPKPVPRLQDLIGDLALRQPAGSHTFLDPLFTIGVRPVDALGEGLPEQANIAVLSDLIAPHIALTVRPTRDSGTCDGLLSRHRPRFSSHADELRWESAYRFDVTKRTGSSADLANAQEAGLRAVTTLLGGDPDHLTTSIQVVLESDLERTVDRIHDSADWVVTIDRHLGVEQYDSAPESPLGRRSQRYILDYSPEFLDGIGHRLAVTTSHRDEVERVLSRAMDELGFGYLQDSVGRVLNHLKMVSGRLALRVLGNEAHAKEAVSLGIVIAQMHARGELADAIVVPVDAHPEIFGPKARAEDVLARRRCDLLVVRITERSMEIELIEVKSRSTAHASTDLLDRIADQIEATEDLLRDLFFRTEPPRVDHKLQRARLQSLLEFYLDRGFRNGIIEDDAAHARIADRLSKLETHYPDFKVVRTGYVVSMDSPATPSREHRGVTVTTLTAAGLDAIGFDSRPQAPVETAHRDPGPDEVRPPTSADPRPDTEPDRSRDSPSTSAAVGDPPQASESFDVSESQETLAAEPVDEVDSSLVAPPGSPAQEEEPAANVNIELGVVAATDEPVSWSIGVKGSPHLFVLGIPGQGKSWTVNRLLRRFEDQALPALVFDFHGQFAADTERGEKVRVLDADDGLPFSPFAPESSPNNWRAQAWEIAEIFEYVCDLGDMQRDVVYQAVVSAYEEASPDENGQRLPSIADVAASLTRIEAERKVKNVVARTRPMLEFGLFNEAPDTDLRTLVANGLVVDVHELTLETVQLAAGAFILRKIYKDMVRWGETDRLRLAIVLDEAHKLARDVTLPKIMKEGRKFGLAVVVASQGLADFHQDVTGNAGAKIIFRTNHPASRKVAGLLRGRQGTDLAAQIEQLGVGEAYVQTTDMPLARKVAMHPIDYP